jgi:hypothetical protein
MIPHQRVAAICRKLNIPFTPDQLHDLVKICEEYTRQVVSERADAMIKSAGFGKQQ